MWYIDFLREPLGMYYENIWCINFAFWFTKRNAKITKNDVMLIYSNWVCRCTFVKLLRVVLHCDFFLEPAVKFGGILSSSLCFFVIFNPEFICRCKGVTQIFVMYNFSWNLDSSVKKIYLVHFLIRTEQCRKYWYGNGVMIVLGIIDSNEVMSKRKLGSYLRPFLWYNRAK